MGDYDRIRWQCRRGLLELDLVLQRFLEQQFDGLSAAEVDTFKLLLEYDDNDLLDLVMCRAEPVDQRVSGMLELLRVSRCSAAQ